MANMDETLISLEKVFYLAYISNGTWLNAVIHNDFVKCGNSGRLFYKMDVANDLLNSRENRNIDIHNFTASRQDRIAGLSAASQKTHGKHFTACPYKFWRAG